MSMIFFKIGTTDLTDYADIQNFNINKQDVFQEWTDGNWIDHRDIVRTRIAGSFQLGFKDSADWSAFLALLTSQKDEAGYYPVTTYVNNTGAAETINAFLDIQVAGKWNLVNNRFWQTVTVNLTQR